jgi:hypothetical protein
MSGDQGTSLAQNLLTFSALSNIIRIISWSLDAVCPKSVTALQPILKCSGMESQMRGQRIAEAAMTRSFDVWRKYME